MNYHKVTCKKAVIAMSLIISSASFAANKEIAIIAVDNNGLERVEIVNSDKLGKKMSRLINEANQSVATQMSGQDFNAGGWKMKKFSLGLGLSGEIGIGPWDIGAAVRQRIIFKK